MAWEMCTVYAPFTGTETCTVRLLYIDSVSSIHWYGSGVEDGRWENSVSSIHRYGSGVEDRRWENSVSSIHWYRNVVASGR